MKLVLQAKPEEVMRAVAALEDFARARGVAEEVIFSLALALEECGSNVVNHALRRDPERCFQVAWDEAGGVWTLELRDDGPAFDPTAALRKTHAAEADAPGGWGIELVRRQMDELHYRREGGENVLRLTKRHRDDAPGNSFADLPQNEYTDTNIAMPLEIEILQSLGGQHPGAITAKLTGSLDTVTAPELERQLAPVLGGKVKDLVFDLTNLKFISSAGLRVFSAARKSIKERGGQTSFVNMQPQIQKVFEIMKALPGVAVFQNTAELDHYLAVQQRKQDE